MAPQAEGGCVAPEASATGGDYFGAALSGFCSSRSSRNNALILLQSLTAWRRPTFTGGRSPPRTAGANVSLPEAAQPAFTTLIGHCRQNGHPARLRRPRVSLWRSALSWFRSKRRARISSSVRRPARKSSPQPYASATAASTPRWAWSSQSGRSL